MRELFRNLFMMFAVLGIVCVFTMPLCGKTKAMSFFVSSLSKYEEALEEIEGKEIEIIEDDYRVYVMA